MYKQHLCYFSCRDMILHIILHTYVLDDTQEHHLSVLKLLHVSYVLYVFYIGCFRTLLTCSTNKTLHVLSLNTGVLLHSLNTSDMFWKCYILVFYLVFYTRTLIFRVIYDGVRLVSLLLLHGLGGKIGLYVRNMYSSNTSPTE